jgi:hypothetical protein
LLAFDDIILFDSHSFFGPIRQITVLWIIIVIVISSAVIAVAFVPTITEVTQRAMRVRPSAAIEFLDLNALL